MKRALKVLSEREVTPQLGLLKSTLLQLDSTFSEREYGAGSFRDFMEKVAEAGAVTLQQAGRSMLVEAVEDGAATVVSSRQRRSRPAPSRQPTGAPPPPREPAAPAAAALTSTRKKRCRPSPMTMQDGIRAVQQAFSRSRRRRAGRCTCGRRSSSSAPPSRASTSGTTASRRWSICCAPPARKACCGSSAIARARCASSPGANLADGRRRRAERGSTGRGDVDAERGERTAVDAEPVDEPPIVDAEAGRATRPIVDVATPSRHAGAAPASSEDGDADGREAGRQSAANAGDAATTTRSREGRAGRRARERPRGRQGRGSRQRLAPRRRGHDASRRSRRAASTGCAARAGGILPPGLAHVDQDFLDIRASASGATISSAIARASSSRIGFDLHDHACDARELAFVDRPRRRCAR